MNPADTLPDWATLEEAADWLSSETGKSWPLHAILKARPELAVWFEARPENAAIMEHVCQGRGEGFMAPIIFANDVNRLEFDRREAFLTISRRPDGTLFKLHQSARFSLTALRFKRACIEGIAQRSGGRQDRSDRRPIKTQAAQEDAILEKLRELGFDPLRLPQARRGKPGAKSQVKKALGSKGMWVGRTVFDKAWDRLRVRDAVAGE